MSENIVKAASEQGRYFPYSGMFYLHRSSFFAAGQDSFTLPPAQNPDLFESLSNIEPVYQGILKRRRGYQLLSSQAPTTPYREGYSYRNEGSGSRSIVFTSTTNVLALNEDGSSLIANLFTPFGSATFAPRMVLSRNYGYFSDGASGDYKKWDGTTNAGNLTNWGISQGNTINGPDAPSTASDTGASWTNVNNVKVSDAVYATATLTVPHSGYANTSSIQATGFGFAVSGTVVSIQVTIQGYVDINPGNLFGSYVSWNARLLKAGTVVGSIGSVLSPTGPPEVSAAITAGGVPLDPLWGSTWTAADINNANFGVQVYAAGHSSAGSFTSHQFIDFISITVVTLGAPITVTPVGGGSITLLSGRVYSAVGVNSSTGATSDLIPFSTSTGPLTTQNVNLSTIPVYADPQVDQKYILATADGGDQTTLFLLASVPNATTTYTDSTTDSTLLTQPVYQETRQDGTLHGVANNKVPPLINFPIKHKGRIYGSIQSTLFFSKNLDDCLTSTGTVTSKWEEAWPSTYQLDISEASETIQGLLSDGETLWIATERAIRRLVGDSPVNFQKPEIQFNETGLLNQDSWKVVFYEGQPVGTMWLTPDFRVMASDFNTYQDVGTPIQNVLNSINTAAIGTIHAMFVSKGPAEYYMLHIPTGSNTTPDTICVYNLRTKTWFVWTPTDLITASLFFIDGSGIPRWTFASNAGSLYEWKESIFQDRVNNTPVLYAASAKTSWLDFGDFTLRKALNQIILGTGDTSLQLTVVGANLDSDLDGGGIAVVTAVPDSTDPLKDLFVPLASAVSKYRFYKFTFTSPASQIQDVLDFYSVEAVPIHRY